MEDHKLNETKEQKFKRIAELRTNNILDKIRLLGNLANTRLYSYQETEVIKIFNAIEKELKDTRAKFHFSKRNKFKL